MRVHLVHGIHTQGAGPIAGLAPFLKAAGFDEILCPDYGYILGLGTKVLNPVIVGTLLPYIQPGDCVVGHSNGCAILYDLMSKGAPIRKAAFINAALEQEIRPPASVTRIDVYFNAGDEVTEAAKLAEELGWVDLVWGEMGHAGYSGSNPNIVNHDCGPQVSGHSAFFEPANLAIWGPILAGFLK